MRGFLCIVNPPCNMRASAAARCAPRPTVKVVRDAQAAPETKVSPERDDGLNRGARNLAPVRNLTPDPEPQTMMVVNPDTGEVEDVPARHVTGIACVI